MKKRLSLFIALTIVLYGAIKQLQNSSPAFRSLPTTIVARRVPIKSAVARQIVNGARAQYGTIYDASFQNISYPRGDITSTRGACSDVIVRALRAANFDLQRLIHDDMTQNFSSYPQKWNLSAPNTDIDHRRVPNQMRFFQSHARVLPIEFSSSTRSSWQPGDIVCWDSGNSRTHTGIVSDGVNPLNVPLIIHNNSVCREEDVLFRWTIIGHYRFPKR